jgi:hypothetical protein
MVLNYLVFKEDLFAVKGGPNPGPHQIATQLFMNHLSKPRLKLSIYLHMFWVQSKLSI